MQRGKGQGARKKFGLWLVVILWGTAVFTTCTPPPKIDIPPIVTQTAVSTHPPLPTKQSPAITHSPLSTPHPPLPTPHPPSPIPHPGTLLFSSRRIDTNGDGALQPPDGIHIYAMNLSNQKLTRLTAGESYDTDPAWSPGGLHIAFVSTRSGNIDLFVMDADGNNIRQLTNTGKRVRHPTWSPDGSRIAFSGGDFIMPSLFVVNVATGDLSQLTDATTADLLPAWSPNGRFITFERTFPQNVTPPTEAEPGIHLLDIDNGTLFTPSQLQPIEPQPQNFHQPQWIPEQPATLSLLQEHQTGTVLRLFELNDEKMELSALPIRIRNIVDYAWTPNGTLLGTFNRGEFTDLAMLHINLNTDGTYNFDPNDETAVSLTTDDYIESNPNWKK